MSRFFLKAKRSLDSLFNLINDLVPDGVLFFRLLSGRFAMCGDRTMFLFISADQETGLLASFGRTGLAPVEFQ